MPSKTYKTRAIVLRKTKLGEKDLIVTLLDVTGALVQGVAKGARKPGGSLAARMELFSVVDVLMAKGRSLDVVCEARLVEAGASEFDLEQSACAAPIGELLCLIAQPDLAQPRLFDMTAAALAHISANQVHPVKMLAVSAACLWKLMAQSGFRPRFATCVACGRAIPVDAVKAVSVSIPDGGAICESCQKPADAIMLSDVSISWCETLIRSRFDDIEAYELSAGTLFSLLQLVRAWVRVHTGRDLKSLDFMFTSGLF